MSGDIMLDKESNEETKHENVDVSDSDGISFNGKTGEMLKRKFGLAVIYGKSPVVRKLYEETEKISEYNVNVLITGESGTGKDLAARAIHYLSPRADKPFIPVNCGAIPDSLFENEFFGHLKGAYTDARNRQIGIIKEADKGTIFLDEISAINLNMQSKLLRLLQNKEYKILGDSKIRKADFRMISATNVDLQQHIKEEKFRKDLFYRLNVVSLYIPPLRERKEDIPLLVKHFINKYSLEFGIEKKVVSDKAMRILISYSWPGNIRELENEIQHAMIMSTTQQIDYNCFKFRSDPIDRENERENLKSAKAKMINSYERSYLISLLTENRGDVVRSAKIAGKSRTALWNILKKHQLSPRQFRIS